MINSSILINYISITRKQIHPRSENSKHYTMPVKIVTMGVAMAIHRRISITGSLCGRLENGHLGKFSASNQLLAFDIHEIHEIRWKPRFHDLKKTNESNASPASSPTSPCRTRQAERETRNEREHTLASWFTKNINSWKFMNTCTLRPHKNCHEKNEKQGQNSGKIRQVCNDEYCGGVSDQLKSCETKALKYINKHLRSSMSFQNGYRRYHRFPDPLDTAYSSTLDHHMYGRACKLKCRNFIELVSRPTIINIICHNCTIGLFINSNWFTGLPGGLI